MPMLVNRKAYQLAKAARDLGEKQLKLQGIELPFPLLSLLQQVELMESCTAQKLAKQLGRDKALLSRMVSKLERQGYVNRAASEADKRAIIITLTEQGAAAAKGFERMELELHRTLTAGLTSEQLSQFDALMDSMLANLNS